MSTYCCPNKEICFLHQIINHDYFHSKKHQHAFGINSANNYIMYLYFLLKCFVYIIYLNSKLHTCATGNVGCIYGRVDAGFVDNSGVIENTKNSIVSDKRFYL